MRSPVRQLASPHCAVHPIDQDTIGSPGIAGLRDAALCSSRKNTASVFLRRSICTLSVRRWKLRARASTDENLSELSVNHLRSSTTSSARPFRWSPRSVYVSILFASSCRRHGMSLATGSDFALAPGPDVVSQHYRPPRSAYAAWRTDTSHSVARTCTLDVHRRCAPPQCQGPRSRRHGHMPRVTRSRSLAREQLVFWALNGFDSITCSPVAGPSTQSSRAEVPGLSSPGCLRRQSRPQVGARNAICESLHTLPRCGLLRHARSHPGR